MRFAFAALRLRACVLGLGVAILFASPRVVAGQSVTEGSRLGDVGFPPSVDGEEDFAEVEGMGSLAIVNVIILPMENDSENVVEDATVIVRGDRIVAVGPSDSVALPSGASVIQGEGRYLIPGLVDAHVHLRSHRELASYLRYGVTTIVNLAGTPPGSPDILLTRDRIVTGSLTGPSIYTTGPILDGDPPLFAEVSTVVTTPDQAVRAVGEQHARGYDFIKLYNGLAPDVAAAVIGAAHESGMATFGHVPRNPDRALALERALEAGLDVVAHGEEFFFTHAYAGVDEMLDLGRVPFRDTARVALAADVVKKAGAAVIPNLSFIAATRRQLDDLPGLLQHPETLQLDAATREMWRTNNVTRRQNLERFDRRERAKYPYVQRLTHELAERGVPLFLGTDTALPGLFPGLSAHLELEELVKAGLTPYEALLAGTHAPAAFIGDHVEGAPTFGVVRPGARADLILLSADPLEDIRNAAHIEGIVLRGRWYPLGELERRRTVVER